MSGLPRVLGGVFFFGAMGLAAELLLLGHVERVTQWIPIVLITAGATAVGWQSTRPSIPALRVVRVCSALLMAGGLLGLYLHLRGNAEFERELHPAAAGWTLWWDALRGATPALAPGALAQLGLVGLAYAWPTLHRSPEEEQR
jgi:hypothetical protein